MIKNVYNVPCIIICRCTFFIIPIFFWKPNSLDVFAEISRCRHHYSRLRTCAQSKRRFFVPQPPNLPSIESLRSIELQIPLRVYSNDAKLIAEFGEMRRSPILFSDIPENFIHALLAAEDDNFANHYGVDPGSLVRAAAQI